MKLSLKGLMQHLAVAMHVVHEENKMILLGVSTVVQSSHLTKKD